MVKKKKSTCNSGDPGSNPGRSLEKRTVTHSSSLACRIPRTEELGGLQSMGRKEWLMHFFFSVFILIPEPVNITLPVTITLHVNITLPVNITLHRKWDTNAPGLSRWTQCICKDPSKRNTGGAKVRERWHDDKNRWSDTLWRESKGPQTKECRLSLEAGKDKQILRSDPPNRTSPTDTLFLAL